jgi:hypothetical protein
MQRVSRRLGQGLRPLPVIGRGLRLDIALTWGVRLTGAGTVTLGRGDIWHPSVWLDAQERGQARIGAGRSLCQGIVDITWVLSSLRGMSL